MRIRGFTDLIDFYNTSKSNLLFIWGNFWEYRLRFFINFVSFFFYSFVYILFNYNLFFVVVVVISF